MNAPQTPPADLRDQLVAYLDGELDAETSQRIDELLSTDPRVRQELAQLERAWDLLDRLPRTEVDQSFIKSTVEMIAVSAAAEVEQAEAALPRRRRRAWLAGAGGMLLAAAAGYALFAALWPHPNDRLLRDLPIIENLDAYRHTADIEFLRQLEKQQVFKDYEPETDNAL